MKFSHLIVGGVLGGEVALLLRGVRKNVNVFALAWVLCATFGSHACAPW
jgi:hypothetical protein